MCGIFGMVGKDVDFQKFRMLSILNKERGKDSSGLYIDGNIIRDTSSPDYILSSIVNDNDEVKINMCLGHSRKASVGRITIENAHPFEFGNIIGAHNGTLTNTEELSKFTGQKFEVDSKYIFYLLNIMPAEEVVKKLEGSFAMWWIDKTKDNRLFMFRKVSPLSYCIDNNAFTFSSEGYHLNLVTESNTKLKDLKDGAMLELNTDTLKYQITQIKGLRKIKYETKVVRVEEVITPSDPLPQPIEIVEEPKPEVTKVSKTVNDLLFGSKKNNVIALPLEYHNKKHPDIFIRCDNCNEVMSKEKMYRVGDTFICSSCRELNKNIPAIMA